MPYETVDRQYHNYLRTFCGDFMDIAMGPDQSQHVSTPTNVVETQKSYRIQVALPGFRRDQIHLKVDDDILQIRAEVRSRKKESNQKYHKQEIFSSSFQRSILLPEDVNDENIRAT